MSYSNQLAANESKYVLSKKDKTYLDVSLSFEPSPVTNDITLLTNERSINNSLKNIVMFVPGEVIFNRDIGSNASKYLFELVDEPTAALLSQEIERAILFCEPRVTFGSLDDSMAASSYYSVSGDPVSQERMSNLGVHVQVNIDSNVYDVLVVYRIVGGEKIFRVNVILTPTR
jgi:phage baseplate assembly protein W